MSELGRAAASEKQILLRKSTPGSARSALPPETDFVSPACQVRKVPTADMQVQTLSKKAINRCGEDYERPVDAFLSGSISDSAENGFVRNAMHPESNAAL